MSAELLGTGVDVRFLRPASLHRSGVQIPRQRVMNIFEVEIIEPALVQVYGIIIKVNTIFR